MATYKSNRAALPAHMQAFGNASVFVDTVATPATFTTTDKAQALRIPAGTTLTGLEFEHTDLDTGATLTVNVGYEPCGPNTTPAANATYFASASTAFRSPTSTAGRTRMAFAPITFEQDVFITLIPAAGPATTAGSITAIATGVTQGIK